MSELDERFVLDVDEVLNIVEDQENAVKSTVPKENTDVDPTDQPKAISVIIYIEGTNKNDEKP